MIKLITVSSVVLFIAACAESAPLPPQAAAATPPVAPATPPTPAPPAPGDACEPLKAQFEAAVAHGGACSALSDCGHFGSAHIPTYACGKGITDNKTAGQLQEFNTQMGAKGCAENHPICPHSQKVIECVNSKCG